MATTRSFLAFTSALILGAGISAFAQANLTDDQIKQEIINQSRAAYSGVCACPYDRMRNGASCGTRSAYSKPGGAAPICYKSDIDQNMVDRYRNRLNASGLGT